MTIPLIIVAAVTVVMICYEAVQPGRAWPHVARWWGRAAVLSGVQVAAVCIAGVGWNGWMLRHRPWSADSLGVGFGGVAGYLVVTFVYYWWHRWRHEYAVLWRWMHQVHHSAQRIEVLTSFYKHPLEIFANSVLTSAVLYLLVGLGPTAAAFAVILTGLGELFYHWNVRTPRWVGYIVQRPESHCIHHQEGVHTYNFADLPVWDMLFGTFRNPRRWHARCGFGPGAEARLTEMLCGVDIVTGRVRISFDPHPGPVTNTADGALLMRTPAPL